MAVNTDVMDPEAEEWKIQVQQIWARKTLRDIHRDFYLSFDTSNCKRGKTPH
jgi:hypothetical protein